MILQKQQRASSRRRGFTLMEVMVVVAILVILASVASIGVFRYLEDAKLDKAKTDTRTIAEACGGYKLRFGDYPTSLSQLVQPPDNGRPFLDSPDNIMDPWGREYQYNPAGPNSGGNKPDVWTITPDNQQIGNWTK
jgi:general secretion pathway protein G